MRPGLLNRPLSIGVQVLLLLGAGLLVAQIVTIGLVLFLPEQRPMFTIQQVAGALGGGPLRQTGLAPLARTVASRPTTHSAPGWSAHYGPLSDLASLLHAPIEDVRLQFYSPPPFAGIAADWGPRPQPASAWLHDRLLQADPASPRFSGPRFRPPLHDYFVASWRAPNGRWVIVTPSEPAMLGEWEWRLFVWFAICFALLAPIAYLFVRRWAAPFGEFARAAEMLGRNPLVDIPALRGPVEIDVAARAFRTMQVRLRRHIDERTAMIGAISHDLRTPLARIRFKLEMLPETDRRSINRDVKQMEEMISSVLTFMRGSSEAIRHDLVDLRSLLLSAVDDCTAAGGDARFVEGSRLIVSGDEVALRRLLTNLMENAIKYGACAIVSLTQESSFALIRVQDRGPGLEPQDLERVFVPFYRSEVARTLDRGGIGLGLAIAKAIVQAHNGELDLANTGTGLAAEVRLPLAAQPAPGAQRVAEPVFQL